MCEERHYVGVRCAVEREWSVNRLVHEQGDNDRREGNLIEGHRSEKERLGQKPIQHLSNT